MDKVQQLERYYNAFISKRVNFLDGLLDYVEYLRSVPECIAILQPIEEERRRKLKEAETWSGEKAIELWGCWDNLCFIDKDTLINLEHLSQEDIPSPEQLKSSATRIHNYLLKEFGRQGYKTKILSFDEDKSILAVDNKRVPIQKFSKQYELLRVVFTEPHKDWQFSEIQEQIDKAKSSWKHLYNLADAIRKKVAVEAGIRDIFITTTQSIKINEKYLEKS